MQDLRDKLLKAGLVDKKQARESKTDQRRQRKQEGGEKAREAQLEAQQERFRLKQEQQAQEARDAQRRLTEEQQRSEAAQRVRNLIKSHRLLKPEGNDQVFYFVGPDRRIRRLATRFEVAEDLGRGKLAIVRYDEDPRCGYAVVDREAALRLEELCPELLLFWNKPGAGEEDLPAYGGR